MATSILVVEDSRTQAEALRAVLVDHGWEVTVAPNGEAALALVPGGPFDLVVTDILMPGITGYEVCRRIKTDLRRPDLPVILLTSLSDPTDIVRGLECGADNFLTKPYRPDHLLERVEHVLRNRNLRQASKVELGITLNFLGSTFTISSDKEQILGMLVSTYEDAVLKNRELRQREQELEAAKAELTRYVGTLEQRLEGVLANVPDVVFSVDATLEQLYYISPACTRVLGFTAEASAAARTRWRAAIHPEDRPRVIAADHQAVAAGRQTTAEYRIRHRDGSERWIQETLSPVRDERGTVVRVDGIARDITEQRRLEEQLRLAQKMEAVGTLAGGGAHDFNKLLAVIRSTTDLALLDLPAEIPVRADLMQVAEVVDRAAALTRQLLAFGRKQVLAPRALDLNALIAGTAKLVERIIGEDVRLALHQTTDPTTVYADPGPLEQVVMNLCANARDAMPQGGEMAILTERVTLDGHFCETHPWARPGDFVRLTVSDTGVGMDATTQARIFEPFFTTKEMGRGTGLGLAVVYGIVKQHAGLIHVYSEPGRGTAFRVYLPFHAGEAEAVAAEAEGEPVGGTETVLLAEDDDALRATATKLLERLGYHVIAVANGDEALEALAARGEAIHVAVLDVVMPGTGGREVFDLARARHPGLRFVLTTGYSPGTSHTEAIRTLPAEVLAKPYGLRALAVAVRRALAPVA